jgi:Zn-finger nucleic acid-binding protein
MRYEACPHCRGLWLNAETLASPTPPVFVLFKNLPGLEVVEDDREAARRCADCNVGLVPRQLGGTMVDICPKCHNIWLGAGEFDRVAEWYRAHPRNEWPRVSQLEARPELPDRPRDRSGLPEGVQARVGRAFGDDRTPPGGDEEPADRMKRAIKVLNDIVDRGLTE